MTSIFLIREKIVAQRWQGMGPRTQSEQVSSLALKPFHSPTYSLSDHSVLNLACWGDK